jgi:uncharacterized protein YegP (UPF0339 family)
MGSFVIKKSEKGEHFFILKSDDLHILLTSQVYSSKSDCLNGIEAVRHNCSDYTRYEHIKSDDNKYYFILKTSAGQLIGQSEKYETNAGLDNGIESVKKNGSTTKVVEEEPYF